VCGSAAGPLTGRRPQRVCSPRCRTAGRRSRQIAAASATSPQPPPASALWTCAQAQAARGAAGIAWHASGAIRRAWGRTRLHRGCDERRPVARLRPRGRRPPRGFFGAIVRTHDLRNGPATNPRRSRPRARRSRAVRTRPRPRPLRASTRLLASLPRSWPWPRSRSCLATRPPGLPASLPAGAPDTRNHPLSVVAKPKRTGGNRHCGRRGKSPGQCARGETSPPHR
jgi:hypothetical protein